jgi:hypothetical protein
VLAGTPGTVKEAYLHPNPAGAKWRFGHPARKPHGRSANAVTAMVFRAVATVRQASDKGFAASAISGMVRGDK